jgi:predicted RNase H-like nuclease
MPVVLGIDAAWTSTEPSGVALLRGEADRWECLAVAPSYEAYLGCPTRAGVDWTQPRFTGSPPEMSQLLKTSERLSGEAVELVAIDMPVSTVPFWSRRQADHEISVRFGGAWCAAHSPTMTRPGRVSVDVMHQLEGAGYPLLARHGSPPPHRGTIEVYPHPAILALMRTRRRLPYKVQKSKRLWPQQSTRERIALLLEQFTLIHDQLRQRISAIPDILPAADEVRSLAQLKRYEDSLDALVCGWVGIEALSGRAESYGDANAAIWVPKLSTELVKARIG